METTNSHLGRSRRQRPRGARLLFEDPAGALRVELFEAGRRSRVRAEFLEREPAERFLAVLKRENFRERYGFVEPELRATDADSRRPYLVSAAVSPETADLEPAALFLSGLAIGTATRIEGQRRTGSQPTRGPRRLPAT